MLHKHLVASRFFIAAIAATGLVAALGGAFFFTLPPPGGGDEPDGTGKGHGKTCGAAFHTKAGICNPYGLPETAEGKLVYFQETVFGDWILTGTEIDEHGRCILIYERIWYRIYKNRNDAPLPQEVVDDVKNNAGKYERGTDLSRPGDKDLKKREICRNSSAHSHTTAELPKRCGGARPVDNRRLDDFVCGRSNLDPENGPVVAVAPAASPAGIPPPPPANVPPPKPPCVCPEAMEEMRNELERIDNHLYDDDLSEEDREALCGHKEIVAETYDSIIQHHNRDHIDLLPPPVFGVPESDRHGRSDGPPPPPRVFVPPPLDDEYMLRRAAAEDDTWMHQVQEEFHLQPTPLDDDDAEAWREFLQRVRDFAQYIGILYDCAFPRDPTELPPLPHGTGDPGDLGGPGSDAGAQRSLDPFDLFAAVAADELVGGIEALGTTPAVRSGLAQADDRGVLASSLAAAGRPSLSPAAGSSVVATAGQPAARPSATVSIPATRVDASPAAAASRLTESIGGRGAYERN